MEELKSTKVDWKKIVVVGMLVVLASLVAGGATWYVSDMGKQAELDVKDEEIASLETRISQLEAELVTTGEEDNTTEKTEDDVSETETETATPDSTQNSTAN
jgi:type II secretory pathway component PulJ